MHTLDGRGALGEQLESGEGAPRGSTSQPKSRARLFELGNARRLLAEWGNPRAAKHYDDKAAAIEPCLPAEGGEAGVLVKPLEGALLINDYQRSRRVFLNWQSRRQGDTGGVR